MASGSGTPVFFDKTYSEALALTEEAYGHDSADREHLNFPRGQSAIKTLTLLAHTLSRSRPCRLLCHCPLEP